MALRGTDATDRPGSPRESQQDLPERRRESRYQPVEGRAFLGWWDEACYRTIAVRVRNLSPSGAALLVEDTPPGLDPVWLCPIGPVRPDWFPADVLGVDGDEENGWIVRVAFSRTFPFRTFKALVLNAPVESAPTSDHRV